MARMGLLQPFSLTRFPRNQYLPRVKKAVELPPVLLQLPSSARQCAARLFSCVSGEFGVSESLSQQIDRLEEIYESELDPQGRAFVSLADTHRRIGDLDKALSVIQDGLGKHPDFASAHMVAGLVHRARRESNDAMHAFERVLELDSQNSLAQAAIAELIDDQRAQAYKDKMAAKKLAEESTEAATAEEHPVVPIDPPVLDDDRPVVSIESLAPDVAGAAPSAREAMAIPDAVRPLVPIQSLAPDATAEIDVAPLAPEAIPDDDRPVVPIESLAPEAPTDRPVVPIASLAPEAVSPAVASDAAPEDEADGVVPVSSLAPEQDGGSLIGLAPIGEKIYTETLAELYAGQGATDKAIETYRKMLELDPDNETFRRRIDELESAVLAPGTEERQTVPIESLAPDGDPEDGTSDDPLSWVNQR
jgi:tetratricopeptide (TPR) repeat protein